MFHNIGGKIKGLARTLCWIGIILSILAGGALIAVGMGFAGELTIQPEGAGVIAGVLVAVIGSLLSWINCFFIYGFGELIEKATQIEQNTRK